MGVVSRGQTLALRAKDWRYEIRRRWEQRWVWRVIALIPREVKKWVVVQAAVRADWDGHPTSVTYVEMADVYSK